MNLVDAPLPSKTQNMSTTNAYACDDVSLLSMLRQQRMSAAQQQSLLKTTAKDSCSKSSTVEKETSENHREASSEEPTAASLPLGGASTGECGKPTKTLPRNASSTSWTSPLQKYLCEILGQLVELDIVDDNAKGVAPEVSCSYAEACSERELRDCRKHSMGWKWGDRRADIERAVLSRTVEAAPASVNEDQLLDDEEMDLVRQVALRFDSCSIGTSCAAAMAPQIPQRRTSYDKSLGGMTACKGGEGGGGVQDVCCDSPASPIPPRKPHRRASYEQDAPPTATGIPKLRMR